MEDPWVKTIGDGDDCKMGCFCCSHAGIWKLCVENKARFGRNFTILDKAKIRGDGVNWKKKSADKHKGNSAHV